MKVLDCVVYTRKDCLKTVLLTRDLLIQLDEYIVKNAEMSTKNYSCHVFISSKTD